jgi:hypothetical protein
MNIFFYDFRTFQCIISHQEFLLEQYVMQTTVLCEKWCQLIREILNQMP